MSFLAAAGIGTAAAEAGGSALSDSKAETSSVADGRSERHQRAIGFAAGLGSSVELELWVESQDVADLIKEAFIRAHGVHPRAVGQPPVPYLAARLEAQGGQGLYRSYPEEVSRSDIDRLERCFFDPLHEAGRLPCNQSDSGCWPELGPLSMIVATSLFPFQLAVFLENAGYVVRIDGKRFAPILKTLETGDLYEPPSPAIIFEPIIVRPEPEKRWTMEDIRLFDCAPITE